MNLNGDFKVEENEDPTIISFTESEKKASDIEVLTALDDSLKTTNSESDVFPDPGDIHFDVKTKQIKEPTEDETLIEMPEVVEDLQGIVVLESAFKELEYVAQDIKRSGGINQLIALEADRCIPGFINENNPIGFYTKAPSATNLKHALEAIDTKKAGIIAAIFAAIMAAFYKIYQWFKNRKPEDLKEEKEELEKEVSDLTEKYREADQGINGGIDKVMTAVAGDDGVHAKNLIEAIDGVTHDVLSSNSVLMKKIHSLFSDNGGSRGFKALIMDIEAALDSISAIAKKQIGSYKITDAVEAETQIKKIAEGIHPSTDKALGSLRYEGHLVGVEDISTDLKNTMNDVSEKRYRTKDFTSVLVGIRIFLKKPEIKAIEELQAIYTVALGQLNIKLEEIHKIVTTGRIETDNHVQESPNYKGKIELTTAVRQLNNQILAIGSIISTCYQITTVRPKRTVKDLRLAYDEAKQHLIKLKHELESEGVEKNASEIKRLEEWLSHFLFSNVEK